MRRLLVLVVAFVVFTTVPAFAETPPWAYPVESYLDWTEGPRRDLGDADVGRYNFEEGFVGAPRRAAERYPEHYLDPDADLRREGQVAVDSAAHMRPGLPYVHAGDAGNPATMPDWDHDGSFGDSGGLDLDGRGDFDADTDSFADTALFATAGGGGVAHELKVVNARGLVLDATLWLPPAAFAGPGCPAPGHPAYGDRGAWAGCVAPSNLAAVRLPGVVFSNGVASRQEYYYWFAMRMVDEGYLVLTYDPAGQGESEGTFSDTLGLTDPSRACGQLAGACRDVQDMTRWFVGQPVTRVPDAGPRVAPRRSPRSNPPNPALPVLDVSRVALAGNSMGAISTLSYLDWLGRGRGADGRPLPMIAAAVSMSGAAPTRAIVPLQFQTSDYDGSPILVGPTLFGISLGANGMGIGYKLIKERYDELRASSDPAPLSLVVLEGGVHTDHVNVPFVPRTRWSIRLAAGYAADWLNCHVVGEGAACSRAVSARPHLSRGFASEQDPDGPSGPSPSRCIRVPDRAMLNQEPAGFVSALRGAPAYDCTP